MYLQTITNIFCVFSLILHPNSFFIRTFACVKYSYNVDSKSMIDKISHSGIVENVTEGHVVVRILQTSACAACKIAGHCNASEAKEKLVDVRCSNVAAYQSGQQVVVSASRDVANRALLLGFGVPFVILVGVLIVTLRLIGNEGVAALLALGALVPYYLLLWLLRDNIGRRVSFQIEPIGNN